MRYSFKFESKHCNDGIVFYHHLSDFVMKSHNDYDLSILEIVKDIHGNIKSASFELFVPSTPIRHEKNRVKR